MKKAGALSPSEALVPITDAVLEQSIVPIAKALAQQMGLSLPGNDKVKEIGALLAFETIKSATEVLFPASLFPTIAKNIAFDPTTFTLAIIQRKLDDISKKLDTLLEKDYHSAIDFLGSAMRFLEHHCYEDANKYLIRVLEKATDAYNCVTNDDLKRIQSTKMKIFGYITTNSYDEESKHFIPFASLPKKKKDLISSLIRDQIEKLLRDLKNVKIRSDTKKFFKTPKQNKKNDDLVAELNACLKSGNIIFTFPVIFIGHFEEQTVTKVENTSLIKMGNLKVMGRFNVPNYVKSLY